MAHSLDAILKPRSVAVIGASRNPGAIGSELFRNLLSSGFQGAVYPVNPRASAVHGVRAYSSVNEIPDDIDLAVIAVPAEYVLDTVDACVEKGVRGFVVITAGFAETGEDGRALQDEILRRVRDNGCRMVGPNCLGVLNTDKSVGLNATFAPSWPAEGGVAFSSQSGALGVAILDLAKELGIGIRHFVSIGNKADVSGNDLLEYWGEDDATKVVLLYLESFGNPQRFVNIASKVARKKPVIAVKSGRTEAGAQAASSHTGSLAGLDIAVDALLGQAGVIRVDTIEELFDVAMLLANQPVPRGHRVAVLTNAGGPGIMAADACESRGLTLATLSEDTKAALRAFLPRAASVRNPVDMLAEATGVWYEKALRILLADEGVDSAIVLFVPPITTQANSVAHGICNAAAGSDKPVLTSFMGTHGVPEALSSLRESSFPSYAFPEAAVIALARAVRYGQWLKRPAKKQAPTFNVDVAALREHLRQAPPSEDDDGRWLEPDEVTMLCNAYGITTLAGEHAAGAEEAASIASRIGFPVALKVASATITHKSDVGGVALKLKDAAAVRSAYSKMVERLDAQGLRDEMEGVYVQAMAPSQGVETFVGMTVDPTFGPLIAFGIGGIYVELWRDIVFRVHPIDEVDAIEMINEVRGKALLDGFRGAPPVDKRALMDTLQRIDQMITDLPELLELDLNPVLALPEGKGAVVVDARFRVR